MNMTEPTQFTPNNLRGTMRYNVDMSRHTSWRAGGCVERLYQPVDFDDLRAFLRTLPVDEPLLAVGLGSNLLVRDGGLRGTVLLMHGALGEVRMEADGLIFAQAGVPGAKLARFAALHELSGAEFFAGIPGTVGGMLAMNAGCYGSETWEMATRVQVLDRAGELYERTSDDYEIGYRAVAKREPSVSTHLAPIVMKREEFFVGAWFKFASGDGNESREAIRTLLNKRIASQPLNLPNAGSVFRNPENDHAARLIESCGLKGVQIGGAQVSMKHANFIVNLGNASASEIESLIKQVQSTVEKMTGIRLHPEVRIVGEAIRPGNEVAV